MPYPKHGQLGGLPCPKAFGGQPLKIDVLQAAEKAFSHLNCAPGVVKRHMYGVAMIKYPAEVSRSMNVE